MKGIIFTEFIEMVEDKFGYQMVDDIIESSDLPSGGIYTSVGTYAHSEMVALVSELSQRSKIPVDALLKVYGKHLFGVLRNAYPQFFEKITSSFDFLELIDRYIHVEVLKLYPDAELPKFIIERISENILEMVYQSERKMSDLADGLLEATLEHYGEKATIQKTMLNQDGTSVKFIITKA
jgi:hypothetical protein